MDIVSEKKAMRAAARQRRAGLAAAVPDHAARLGAYADALPIPPNSLVSAYVAMGEEADPKAILARLAEKGCRFAFPRVAAMGAPLVFHHAVPDGEWVRSRYGVLEPQADWPVAAPEFFLMPLLAFDAQGWRLGYGGGFYDRTLAAHRADRPVVAIGIAFSGQEVAAVPHDDKDQRLDMVVTEMGLRRLR